MDADMSTILFATLVLGAMMMTWYQARAYRKVAAEVLASNERVAAQAAEADAKTAQALFDIHKLVNSNLSAAQQGELNATRRDLASLQEVVSLKESQGIPVSSESLGVIDEVKERIAEMTAAIHTKERTS